MKQVELDLVDDDICQGRSLNDGFLLLLMANKYFIMIH